MLLTVITLLLLCLDIIFIYIDLRSEQQTFYRPLALILFLGIFHLLFGYISSILYSQWLYLTLCFPLGLLYGPAFFLLVKDLGLTKPNRGLWKHLIPFYFSCFIFTLLILQTSLRYQYHFEYAIFLHFFSLVQLVGYIIWLWPVISPLRVQLSTGLLRTATGYALFIVMLGLCMKSLLQMVVNGINMHIQSQLLMLIYLFFLLSVSFLLLLYGQVRRNNRNQIEGSVSKQSRAFTIPTPSKKRTTTRKSILLTRDQEIAYRFRIEIFIETLAFLDSDMNKDKFCQLVEIPSSHVASFLKQEFGRGFNGFINQLRLNYAARQLRSDDLIYTIEDLSLICGFSSRASFYRNFQTEFGCSPHQFRFEKKSAV